MRFWYFGEQGETRDAKVQQIVSHLNDTMRRIYTPDRNLSLDESMMLWRGRLVFRQYIKNKKHKYGVKFFELCQYDGLVVRASIYTGTPYDDPEELGQTGATVLHLMEDFVKKGYAVYCDNYYNSVPLTESLTAKKTNICGTLRKGRKHLPKNIINKKMKKGQYTWQSNGSTVVCKWKDKRDVLTISNKHSNVAMTQVKNRRGNIKLKPIIVEDYNKYMSGVDREDQMLSYHSALRKTLRWYKKVGLHVLEMFLLNAYYLFKLVTQKNIPILQFRESVVGSLVGQLKKKRFHKPKAEFHYLVSLPATEKKAKPTARCAWCKQVYEEQQRRQGQKMAKHVSESRYYCEYCPEHPPLHVDPCFRKYHEALGVARPASSDSEEEVSHASMVL